MHNILYWSNIIIIMPIALKMMPKLPFSDGLKNRNFMNQPWWTKKKKYYFYEPAMLTSEHCCIHVGVLPLDTGLEIMNVCSTKWNPTESARNDVQSFPIQPPPPPSSSIWDYYFTTLNTGTRTLTLIPRYRCCHINFRRHTALFLKPWRSIQGFRMHHSSQEWANRNISWQ